MVTEAILHKCAVALLSDHKVPRIFAPSAKTWTLRQLRSVQDARTHLQKERVSHINHYPKMFLPHRQRQTMTI